MRKEVGVLLGLGGAALVWLLKDHWLKPVVHDRNIVLGPGNTGCRVAECPKDVKLSMIRKDRLIWHISNPSPQGSSCDRQVKVSLENWRRRGDPVAAPVVAQGGGALFRMINPRQPSVPLPVMIAPDASRAAYTYQVFIDGTPAQDPMVEIVP